MLCFTSAVEILPPSRFIGQVCPSRDTNTLVPMLAIVEPLSDIFDTWQYNYNEYEYRGV